MSHNKKHKVELFQWIENVLRKTIHFFADLAAALHFVKHTKSHDAKVYNDKNEVIHCKNKGGDDSYA